MDGVNSVLLVTPRWVRDGGVGAHLSASASALVRAGMQVSVLAARVEDSEQTPGVRVFHNPQLFNREASMEARLGEALATGPAIVHFHQLDEPDAVTFARRSAPVLISAHGFLACTSRVHYFRPGQECQRAHGPGCVPNLIARGCAHTRDPRTLPGSYRRAGEALEALERADLAISYSSAVDRHLAINGLTRRRIVPYFPTMQAATNAAPALERRVLFAGRLVAPKGVPILIRAARKVDAQFVICGDGRELEPMRRLAKRMGVEDRIEFAGWLGPAQLADEFARAAVVVVPSLWPEPFGLVGIEAFAASRPAIASMTGGVGDWLTDGVSGIGVPAGDERALAQALSSLLADPAAQQRMGEAGHQTVMAKFSPEHHVAAIREAYGAAHAHWSSRDQHEDGMLTGVAAPEVAA